MRQRKDRPYRRRVRLLVTYWEAGKESDYRTGYITNLSDSGVYVVTDTPAVPPTRLNLRLILDDETVDVMGEVVRSIGETQFVTRDGSSGMGIRFVDPQSAGTRTLRAHGMGLRKD